MKISANLLRKFLLSLLATGFFLMPACTGSSIPPTPSQEIISPPFSLTLLHVGDTDACIIPHEVMMKFNGNDTLVPVGGWSLLMATVEDIRSREKNVMLLHAGDVAGDTIWGAKFGGLADIDAMNTLQFDAMAPGDSDLSGGLSGALTLLDKAAFPVLAANMDTRNEPSLAGLIKPYTIVKCGDQQIGLIGLVTPYTVIRDDSGKNIAFSSPVDAARQYVSELKGMGINKIIVLSHLGYSEDIALTKSVSGIDVIVGAHSATFMGGSEFEQIGLKPDMPYPTEMKGPSGETVLIAHAWKDNRLLGQLKLNFDEKGRIGSYQGQPLIPAMNSFQVREADFGWVHLCSCRSEFDGILQILANNPGIKLYWNNAEMENTLQPYIGAVSQELNTIVAMAEEDMFLGLNRGPGPVIADALLWSARRTNPDVHMAVYDSKRVGSDIFQGDILLNSVYMLVPYRQTLVTMRMNGATLKAMLEKGIDAPLAAGLQPPFYEISGLRMTVDLSRGAGSRITGLQLQNADGSYINIDPNGLYTLVTDSSLAGDFIDSLVENWRWLGPLTDGLKVSLEKSFVCTDAGIRDTDALTDYLRAQKNIRNLTTERMAILPTADK